MKLFYKLFILVSILACASTGDQNDPLKNTKKIVASGHKSLYYNGAFEVTGTSIKLIPAFSEAEVFVAGQRFGLAKQAFSENMKKARESVVILKEGKKLSFEIGDKISTEGKIIADKLKLVSTDTGTFIISKSLAESYGIFASSPTAFKEMHEQTILDSKNLRIKMDKFSDDLSEADFPAANRPAISERAKEYRKEFKEDLNTFVIGYVNLNDLMSKFYDESKKKLESKSEFGQGLKESLENFINSSNEALTSQWKETIFDFGAGTAKEFKQSQKEIEDVADGKTWLPFAVLKAFSRATKGILYDGLLKPVAEIGAVSVGYIAVNSIWPVAIVGNGTVKVARVFVELLKVSTNGIIYLIAPTAKLGLAALLTNGKFIANEAYNGADNSVRAGANAGIFLAAKTVKGSGIVTEGAGTYVLAPIMGGAAFSGKGIYGAGVAVGGTATGGGISLTTTGAAYATEGSAKAADYALSGIGTGISAGASFGYGVYQVGKAVGVPTGIALKGGVVLSYEMTAQLSAHSLLAVSDFSYLVLSLEGEKWVIYAVKDTSGKAKSLLTGSVIDLEKVRKQGDEIKKVPVSDEEIEKILENSKKE